MSIPIDNKTRDSASILQRLIDALAIKNQVQLAKVLGVSKNMPSTWKERGTIPIKVIMDISKRENLDLNWILLGEGAPHNEAQNESKRLLASKGILGRLITALEDKLQSKSQKEIIEVAKREDLDINWIMVGGFDQFRKKNASDTKNIESPFVLIPRYDVTASAGHGHNVEVEVIKNYAAYRKDWVKELGLKEEYLSQIKVIGDSMEPKLSDGDTVMINTEDKEIRGGSAYVVRIGTDLMVKYLERLPGDKIQVSSENPVYKPYTIKLSEIGDDFSVIGKVVNSTRDWK